MGKQWETLFLGAPKSLQMVTAAMKLKDICSLKEKLWPTYRAYYKAETLLGRQNPSSQSYGFSSSHVWMWEVDYKESCCCCKSLQSCLTLCDHIDGSPLGSPIPGILVGCHFSLQCMKVKSENEVAQWCPTLRDPMACSLAGSSIHGIFQARVLEWVPFPSPEKSEYWRIDAFELWCWKRLLRVSWTARRSNQSVLKEISPEYSLEGLMLKLKLQYFCHLMQRTDSLEKTLMLGKIDGRRRKGWDGWMLSPTQWTWVWESSGCWRWTGKPGILHSIGSQRVGHTEWLHWTETLE